MGIEIVLYDSSPIVQKIFFHILYHYSPIVHRIDETSALMEKIQYSKPDIIFIDAALSKNNNLVNKIHEKKEELKKIPIILMSKTDLDQRELESVSAQDILKKPIEAQSLRQLITRFVSKTKSNILTKHLEFPSIPNFIENQDKTEQSPSKEQKKPAEAEGINLVTETEESQPPKEQSPPKEQKASIETGINIVTETKEVQLENKTPSPKKQSPPKEQKTSTENDGINLVTETEKLQPEKEQSPPKEQKAYTKTGINIKPVTSATEKKEDTEVNGPLIKKPVSQKEETKSIMETQKPQTIEEQQEAEEFKQPDTPEEQQEAEEFKQPDTPEEQQQEDEEFKQPDTPEEESSTDPVKEEHTITESDLNIQMKSKVDDYIKTIGEEILKVKVEEISEQKIQEEIDRKIKDYQDTILKTIEKSVWQVVPELARQLIIKEIDRILKEEETE